MKKYNSITHLKLKKLKCYQSKETISPILLFIITIEILLQIQQFNSKKREQKTKKILNLKKRYKQINKKKL